MILIFDRTASYKFLSILGPMISSVGYLLLILRWRGDTNFWESLYILPGGFGTGVIYSTAFVGLAAGVDESQMAMASSTFYLSGNIGALVGTSLTNTILQTRLRTELGRGLQRFPDRDKVTVHVSLMLIPIE